MAVRFAPKASTPSREGAAARLGRARNRSFRRECQVRLDPAIARSNEPRLRGAFRYAVTARKRPQSVRLREKDGKRHAMPCHHNLEEYLTAYLDGPGLRSRYH